MAIQTVTWVKDITDSSKNQYMIVVNDGVTMSVPLDPANRHYQDIQKWVADGNTIAEPA